MTKKSGSDSRIARYHALKPREFSCLGRMELRQRFDLETGQYLILELYSRNESMRECLILIFENVCDLRFSPGSWSTIPVYLEITSIHDNQWERANYRVSDGEHIDFSFYCESFTSDLREHSAQ